MVLEDHRRTETPPNSKRKDGTGTGGRRFDRKTDQILYFVAVKVGVEVETGRVHAARDAVDLRAHRRYLPLARRLQLAVLTPEGDHRPPQHQQSVVVKREILVERLQPVRMVTHLHRSSQDPTTGEHVATNHKPTSGHDVSLLQAMT